ncbi:hypothetical protein [Chamaesiphon sp. VAR_48_metabat_403]|uniref:hypothetical protein n=1 Tax=Chamaesiphon sp. VAR_48_metabat_403 TaxID=2964700 RepID=UPI00286DC423|nr:hypothetical protein [Chamaesiphon sp. VAR_48_metabat_403]
MLLLLRIIRALPWLGKGAATDPIVINKLRTNTPDIDRFRYFYNRLTNDRPRILFKGGTSLRKISQ